MTDEVTVSLPLNEPLCMSIWRISSATVNSKHANTSSSVAQAAATTSAAMMATATQMRATLIYLAPFLHPCKNVVPGTSAATTTQQHLSADWDGAEDVEVLQKTHVARVSATPTTGTASLSSSTAGSRSSMTRRGGGVVGAHSNSNRNVTTTSCAGTNTLLHPGGHNNHYNNAINCNSTVINASTGVRHASGGNGKGNSNSNDISSSSIRSSCCHHNNAATERQDLDDTTAKLQWPDAKTTTTTTKTTTTTMFASANNKISQQQQQTEQSNDQGCLLARVVENPQKPADNPSLSATTSINSCRSNTTLTSSGMWSGGMVPSTKSSLAIQQDTKTTTSFVNYPNSRSTKYLRERGRRHHHQQQQQQGHTSTLALAPVGRQPLKKLEEFQLEQRRKSPCGRYSHPDLCSNATTTTAPASAMAVVVIDNHNTAKCCNNNQMANTSLLSRCHDSNKTLSNVPASQDHNNNVQDEEEEDGHHDLILRHSLEGSGNAIGNEIFYTHNDNVLPTPAPSVSSSSSSSTSSTSSSSSASASASASISTSTSYTTILNKESVATTATPLPASSFPSCCIINSNADSSSNALSRQQPVLDLSATTSSTVSSTSMEESSSPSTASSLLATAASLSWWRCWCWLVALFGCSKLTKTVTVSKWLFMWLLFVVLSSPAQCWAGRND
uniref:Uncharacterized protein n=1 Tax=Musca domestica TaxID=7370 RepID=A0A1I8NL66_MUSDO